MPIEFCWEFEGKIYPENEPPPILIERIEQAWIEKYGLVRPQEEKKAG